MQAPPPMVKHHHGYYGSKNGQAIINLILPLFFLFSYFEPVPTITKIVAVLVPLIGAVIKRRLFFSF